MKKALLIGTVALTPFLFGTNITWSGGGGDNNWDTPSNWTGGVVPNSSGQVAILSNNIGSGMTIHLQTSISPDQINSSAANSFTIDSTGGKFSFTASPSIPQFSISTDGLAISPNITLGTIPLEFYITGGSSVTTTFSGSIDGTGTNFTKSGTGTLIITGTTNATGNTSVTAGTLKTGVSGIPGNVTVSSGGKLYFTQGGETTSKNISGGGEVHIDVGNGNLFIITSQSNTYTGGTVIDSGRLAISNTLSGGMTIPDGVTLNGALRMVFNADASFSDITGSGQLQIQSTAFGSTLTLGGTSSYSGGTLFVSDSDLQGTTSSLQGTIASSSSNSFINLIFNQSTDGNFSGTLAQDLDGSGDFTGSLVKLGTGNVTMANNFTLTGNGSLSVQDGTLTLSTGRTYNVHNGITVSGGTLDSQGTLITAGNLSVSSGSMNNDKGDLTVNAITVSGGTLSNDGPLTRSGNITISGGTFTNFTNCHILGAGNLSITNGTFTNSGTYAPGSGTVSISNGTLTNTNVGTMTLPSTLSVSGGTVSLDGNNNTITGPVTMGGGTFSVLGVVTANSTFTVTGGTLSIDGTLTVSSGSLLIDSDATLIGTGTVGPHGLSLNGTISPGHSPGTITINGASTFGLTSVTQIEVTPSTNDLIVINGTLQIDPGSTLHILANTGNYSYPLSRTIIEATGGVSGTFTNVTTTYPLIGGIVTYDDNDVYLVVTVQPVTTLLPTGNAGKVADCIVSFNPPSGSDMEYVISQLSLVQSGEQLTKALNQLQHSQYTALALAQQEATLSLENTIEERLSDRDAPCSRKIADFTPWVTPFGVVSRQVKKESQPGYTTKGPGVFIGIDDYLFTNFILGGGLGYTQTALNWTGNRGHATTHSGYASIYGRYETGRLFLQGSLIGAMSNYKTQRNIDINVDEIIDRRARGSHLGYEGAASLKGGFKFNVARTTFTPFIYASYIYDYETAFDEHGAESLDLGVKSKRSTMIYSEAGIKLSRCGLYETAVLMPFLQLSVIRESRFKGSQESANFNSCLLDVTGFNPSRTLGGISAGVNMTLGREEEAVVSVYYKGKYTNKYQENDVYLQFGWNF